MEFKHKSVLLNETLSLLNIKSDGIYVDGTLGGAGHSKALLQQAGKEARLVGIDRDPEALAAAEQNLSQYTQQVTLVHANYAEIKRVLQELHIDAIDGCILISVGYTAARVQLSERCAIGYENGYYAVSKRLRHR